ncbi:MAG: bluetail domain-containing putative surface protein, partial [Prochlorococcus sp.]
NNEPIVTTAFDLSGNDYSNTIIGNSADNILSGGNGPDTITGQEGRDTFQINSLNESKLWDSQSSSFAYDIITDFEIGKDIIDAPYQVASSDIVRVSDPTAIELSKDLLSNLLPADVLPAYGAAIVSLTASNDDYLILNNYRAGFKSTTDSVIEISNYIGDLDDLMII